MRVKCLEGEYFPSVERFLAFILLNVFVGKLSTGKPFTIHLPEGKTMLETTFLDSNSINIENLKGMPVLEPFDDQELNNLLEMSKIRKYKAGECIVCEGQSDTWLYFLMYGQIRISKGGKEVAVLSRKGEILGEMGAVHSSRRSASAHAITDTVCLATDIFYLEKLTGNEKATFGYVFYRLMSEILAKRLRATTDELIKARGRFNLKFW